MNRCWKGTVSVIAVITVDTKTAISLFVNEVTCVSYEYYSFEMVLIS